MMPHVVSSAWSWLPLLLRPQKTLKSLIECWSSYDPSGWKSELELMDAGILLGFEMLIPAFLLCLVGSFLPSLSLEASIDADERLHSFLVQRPMVDAFSPYTSSLASASLTFPTFIKIQHSLLSNFDLPYLLRLTTLFIFSPVTLDVLCNHFSPILIQVLSRLRVVLMNRKGPDDITKANLSQRIKMGRVIHRYGYDLYLPPKSSEASKSDLITSLLFFPGFGIQNSAYADVMGRISDYGIPAIAVSLEPLRLAHKLLGGGMEDVRRLIKSAGKEVANYYNHMHREYNGDNSIDSDDIDRNIIVEWALGGHSMGGYNVLQLAEELMQTNPPSILLHDGSTTRVGQEIVAWAAGTAVDDVPNLREASSSSSFPLRIFIQLASNDRIAKFPSQQDKLQLISKLPANGKLETIKGGNHSGFASYDTAMESASDGTRDIPLEDQQREVSRRTASFLLGN